MAIIEEACGIPRYKAELMTAELYSLSDNQRQEIFPVSCLDNFNAVLYMAKSGICFLPWDNKESRPAFKWGADNQKNFTNEIDKLLAWKAQGYNRFIYLPGLSGLIGIDIDRGHADGKDGLTGFYEIMTHLAGKSPERLPSYLRSLPDNFPCYVQTPSGGFHLLFKYTGPCKTANLKYGDNNLEIKYMNTSLSLGEKSNGVYVLRGSLSDAPELPAFLIRLIDPKQQTQPAAHQYKKPSLEKICDKVLTESSGNNDRQKKFAWRAAYFNFELDEVMRFVKLHPDAFGNGSDTETVVDYAWRKNKTRAVS